MNFLITDCIVKNDCLNVIKPNRDRILLDNEDLVYDYLRLTLRKDIRHVLDLFTEDAIIHEPFSKPEDSGLKVNTIIMIFWQEKIHAHPQHNHRHRR